MSSPDLYTVLDNTNIKYNALHDVYNSQNQIVMDMQKKALAFGALSTMYDSMITDTNNKVHSLNTELSVAEGDFTTENQKLTNLKLQLDDDTIQIDNLTNNINETGKNTISVLLSIYENIKKQNNKIYKMIKKINSENSLGEKKILYLKDKTSSWDIIFSVLFYAYYLLFFYLCFLIYNGYAKMAPIWNWSIVIFFALFPTIVGIYTTYPTFPFYAYVEKIIFNIRLLFRKLFQKR
jgi:hypothetical protein